MVLLLTGNEPYCIAKYIKIIKNDIEHPEINYYKTEYFEDNEFELAYQFPLLASKRLIHLSLDKFEMSPSLEKYIDVPCEHTDLIITCVTGIDKRTSFYKKLQKNKMVKVFDKVDETTLKKFIFTRIKKNQVQITEDAYNLLLQYLRYYEDENCNLYTVDAAITKLCLLKQPITVEYVEQYVEKSIDNNIFALAGFLAKKDIRALDLLNGLIENKEDSIYILSLLLRSLRLSYKTTVFQDEQKAIGVPSYQIQRFANCDRIHLVASINMVTEAIQKLKNGYPGECILRDTVSRILV